MKYLASLKHPLVLACLAIALIVVIADFAQRVYTPLTLGESRNQGEVAAQSEHFLAQLSLPSTLQAWLNQTDEESQARIAAEQAGEQSPPEAEVLSLTGGEYLDSYQVRVRAVFIQRYQDDAQYLAVGEILATEGSQRGEISRRLFRLGDTVADFAVHDIEPGVVHFRGPTEQLVSVNVFNPLKSAIANLDELSLSNQEHSEADPTVPEAEARSGSSATQTEDILEQLNTSGMSAEEIEEFKMLLELRRQNNNGESEN